MNKGKTTRAEALLWSLIIAVVITGAVHAAANMLPDWFSARHAKPSALENAAARFSEYWLMKCALAARNRRAGFVRNYFQPHDVAPQIFQPAR